MFIWAMAFKERDRVMVSMSHPEEDGKTQYVGQVQSGGFFYSSTLEESYRVSSPSSSLAVSADNLELISRKAIQPCLNLKQKTE